MFCHHCGIKLPDAARFCPDCGTQRDLSRNQASGTVYPSESVAPNPSGPVRFAKKRHRSRSKFQKVMLFSLGLVGLCLVFSIIGVLTNSDNSSTSSTQNRNNESATREPTVAARDVPTSRTVSAPTKVPPTQVPPTRVPPPTKRVQQPLEILNVTSKDAGIGDGSAYVYADVVNHSSELFSYVGLEATCRNASGQTVATGIGNTMNLAPGETTTITIVMMAAQGCEKVQVEVDDLTGLFN